MPPVPLGELLAGCAVAVHVGGTFKGSGVLVAGGEVLTCAHVVASAVRDGKTITVAHEGVAVEGTVRHHTADSRASGQGPYSWPDLAWLEVPGLAGQPWVELDRVAPREDDELVGRGFSDQLEKNVPSRHPARYLIEGSVDREEGTRWQLKDAQVAPGMSGTGLANPRTGRLLGLLTRSRDTDTDLGGWAVHAHSALESDPGFADLLTLLHEEQSEGAVPGGGADQARDVAERWVVAAGLRKLLSPPYEPLPARHGPAALLVPRYGVIPFHPARQPALDDLTDWATTAQGPLVRLVTGPAGTGKTRLAAELAHQLVGQGWLTGFLPTTNDPAHVLDLLTGRADPVLLVVDYAETRTDLPDILANVADLDERGATIKVLLLARAAGEWWSQLSTLGERHDLVEAALTGAQPAPLEQLANLVDDPTPAYVDAITALAGHQALAVPDRETLPALATTGNQWSYLLVHLAALNTVGTPDEPGAPNPTGQPVSPTQVLTRGLDRELKYWRDTADREHLNDVPTTVLGRTITALSLLGATHETDAATTLTRVPDLSDATEQLRRALARWVHHHYPPSDPYGGWTSGLQPDLLAETHIVQDLANSPDLDTALLTGLDSAPAVRALTVLTRAARHQPAATTLLDRALQTDLEHLAVPAMTLTAQTGPDLADHLSRALHEQADDLPWATLDRLQGALPEQTTTLVDVAVTITSALVTHHRGGQDLEPLARSLNSLSIRLSAQGCSEDALTATAESVAIYRDLAASLPDTHSPSLAAVLNNQANRLSELGRHDEALVASEEAVVTYQYLVAIDHGRYASGLASALNTKANQLSDVGRPEDALVTSEVAVTTYRALAATHPEFYAADLAMALNNHTNRLSALGRLKDALTTIDQTVKAYYNLASVRPDAYTADLAMALNNQAQVFSALGYPGDALMAIQESVETYRALADSRPAIWTPDLAMSLTNLSVILHELNRSADALDASHEATALYRKLARERPSAHAPRLAGALFNMSDQLEANGRTDEALAATDEAVNIQRQLAADHPGAQAPQLAIFLTHRSRRLGALGRIEDALTAISEAIPLYRNLAHRDPNKFEPQLALALTMKWFLLRSLGKHEAAVQVNREAVQLWLRLQRRSPERYSSELDRAVANYQADLRNTGVPQGEIDGAVADLLATQE